MNVKVRHILLSALAIGLAACDDASRFRRLTDVNHDLPNDEDSILQNEKGRYEAFTQVYAAPKHDILWVIDNSGSMNVEINYVKDNVEKFAQRLWLRRNTVDFQMSLAVTDYLRFNGALQKIQKNGQDLYAIPGLHNQFAPYMRDLLNTIPFADGPTEGYEMGLITAKAAIENHGSKFMRMGSSLHVVTISDEEDWSCDPTNVPAGKFCGLSSDRDLRPDTIPDWYRLPTSYFVDYFKTLTRDVYFFPVVGIKTENCNNVSTLGTRYAEVQKNLPHGETLDICENVIESNLDRIAAAIGDLGSCFKLKEPVDPNWPLAVKVGGERMSSGWSLDINLNQVCFIESAIPSNGSSVEIFYRIK